MSDRIAVLIVWLAELIAYCLITTLFFFSVAGAAIEIFEVARDRALVLSLIVVAGLWLFVWLVWREERDL
jgi:hypothetical protein